MHQTGPACPASPQHPHITRRFFCAEAYCVWYSAVLKSTSYILPHIRSTAYRLPSSLTSISNTSIISTDTVPIGRQQRTNHPHEPSPLHASSSYPPVIIHHSHTPAPHVHQKYMYGNLSPSLSPPAQIDRFNTCRAYALHNK